MPQYLTKFIKSDTRARRALPISTSQLSPALSARSADLAAPSGRTRAIWPFEIRSVSFRSGRKGSGMQLISKQTAQAFAEALIANHGNATAAARALQYDDAPGTGHRYSRHPLVLAALAPLAQAHLNSLTPKAIQTLGALLHQGSAYVRLEAAKDILDRNGVGTSREPPRSSQLVVNINLQTAMTVAADAPTVIDSKELSLIRVEEGGLENSVSENSSTSPAHDFSPPAHDFSLGVLEARETVPQPLDLELEVDN
jgi:hypothetical protein